MKIKLPIVLFAYFLISFNSVLHSFIIESNHIQDVLKYVSDEDTLVIFDIDNTIGRVDKLIGSEAWFYHMINTISKTGKNDEQAVEELLPLATIIHEHLWLIPVENETPSLIKELQNRKINVIALTARATNILDRTIEQLKHMDINFQVSALTQKEFDFTFNKHDKYRQVFHKDGVIFCGRNNKGDILMHIFIHLNYFPKRVVFIDDKRKYLECVQQAMNRMGIEFVGLRYTKCDQLMQSFDSTKAEKELQDFENQLRYS